MGVQVFKEKRQVHMLLQLAEYGSVGAVLRRLRARGIAMLPDEAVAQLALHTCSALAHVHRVFAHTHQCAPPMPSVAHSCISDIGERLPYLSVHVCASDLALQCLAHGLQHVLSTDARRDVKPDNLAISEAHVQLIDFGCARFCTIPVPGKPDIGSPAFRAPEAAKWVSTSVDIWALGVMLFLCITGYYPFEDEPGSGSARDPAAGLQHEHHVAIQVRPAGRVMAHDEELVVLLVHTSYVAGRLRYKRRAVTAQELIHCQCSTMLWLRVDELESMLQCSLNRAESGCAGVDSARRHSACANHRQCRSRLPHRGAGKEAIIQAASQPACRCMR